MDLREYIDDPEEMMRLAHASLAAGMMFAMPAMVTEDSADGHTVSVLPTIKRRVIDPVTSLQTFEDWPVHVDVPIHHLGGGPVTHTTPTLKGDEGHLVYMSRQIDAWHQNGGTQQPLDNAINDLKDVHFIKGVRSDPRKISQVPNTSSQVRDDAKQHTIDLNPTSGITHKSVDPSTAPASASFDPFTMASKFVDHAVQGAKGLLARAVSGATTHDHGIDFANGPFMRAANALHSVLCHPSNGASLNAQNLLHSVTAGPLGAIMSAFGGKHTVSALASGLALQSATGISLSCPPGTLGLPAASVSGGSLGSGAASQNVGVLGGDLAGTLPNPTVTGLHVDFSKLPTATSDSAAAAAGVAVGGLYRDTSIASGVSLLAVRMA